MKNWLITLAAILTLTTACLAYPYLPTDDPALGALNYIKSYQNASDGSFLNSQSATCWSIIALEAAGENISNAASWLVSNSGSVSTVPDYARTILALVAAGKDPSKVGGGLIAGLKSFQDSSGKISSGSVVTFPSDTSDTIWGVLALSSVGDNYSAYLGAKWLKEKVNPDGCWGYDVGASSDSNDCAAAIQALVSVGDNSTELSNAVAKLKTFQNADGGFLYDPAWGSTSDSSSDAWAMQAALAAGYNPQAWANATGTSVIDNLLSIQNTDGSFNWTKDSAGFGSLLFNTYTAVPPLLGKSFPTKKLSPDFVASVSSIQNAEADAVNITIEISNTGLVGAANLSVNLSIDSGAQTQQVLSLQSGQSANITLQTTDATHAINISVDPENHFTEPSKLNNIKSLSFGVSHDLYATISSPSSATKGNNVQSTVSLVLNESRPLNKPANAIFNVTFYVDNISKSSQSVTMNWSDFLTPSKKDITFDWAAAVGTHELKFFIDSTGEVSESNESNNNYTSAINVSDSGGNGGGGGGPSGGGITTTTKKKEVKKEEPKEEVPATPAAQPSSIDFSSAPTVSYIIAKGEKKDFSMGAEQHSVTVKDITSDSVTLTVMSNPMDVSLKLLEIKKIDLNSDGDNDLSITLNSITDGKADISFTRLWKLPSEAKAPTGFAIFSPASLSLVGLVGLAVIGCLAVSKLMRRATAPRQSASVF